MRIILVLMVTLLSIKSFSQHKFEFDGQVTAIGSYSWENELNTFIGGRYIPELYYGYTIDTNKVIDFEASVNFSGSLLFHPFDSLEHDGNIDPYRIWARYSDKQYEIRLGLQKIDFGSAVILRPLQWFNQIDPRDPLQITNGVYGTLGRYYFLNNANIWLWVLIGNENPRGFDVFESNKKIPETGTRIQYPIPKGEIALSYHYRMASSNDLFYVPEYDKISENRIGIDGKWDLEVGLWFEASYNHKSKNVGKFTNQTLISIGTDYTIGIGNGLNLLAEHLVGSFDEDPFEFKQTFNLSALSARYPFTFTDNLSTIFYYSWTTKDLTFFINYEHQFKHITGYLMAYYNPDTPQTALQSDIENNFSGPGFRVMLVYNY